MNSTALFYRVREGDTLSKIAKRYGTSAAELSKINGLKNANKIAAGQRIALRAEAVCKVKIQLLDRDRNPIPNVKARIEYCGKLRDVASGKNGCLPDILTETPDDNIKVFIARADSSWKEITEIVSGWGNKLVTLVSPKIRIQSETRLHPKDETGLPRRDGKNLASKPTKRAALPVTTVARGTPQNDFGDGKGLKTENSANENGLPTAKVTNDQSSLDFLAAHVGGKLSEDDYKNAAKNLGCEVNVIKAVAQVESGGKSGFDKLNRPVILYERHVFSRNSGRRFDQSNSDLSSKTGYKLKKKGETISAKEKASHYYSGSSDENYARLSKAYSLDPDAALKACSWGKFQVLGENYNACGYPSVRAFVDDQVRNEAGQLRAFVGYIKARKLQKHLKEKNWAKIAEGYNGKHYKKFKYDERIKSAYEALPK